MKPRVIELPRRRWDVDFGDGRTATIREGWDMGMGTGRWSGTYYWCSTISTETAETADASHETIAEGDRDSFAEAFVSAWISVAVAPPALYLELEEVEAMATECERGDAGDTAKMLRELLRQRTGLAWSCKAGDRRGRDRFRVLISAPKSRLVDGALSVADRVMLSTIFGCRTSRDGITVEPHRGCRAFAVWRAAGLERAESRAEPASVE